MKIKTVSAVLTTNSIGQPVESRPVRTVAGPVLNEVGQWVSPTVVEEAADGIPVRYVTDPVVLNSVGQPVAATPVKGGGVVRIVDNRGEIPTATTTAGTNSLRAETRKLHTFPGDLDWIQFGYAGYYVNGGLEVAVGNDQAVQSALEIAGAPTQVARVTFDGGQSSGAIINGVALYLSDRIYPSALGLSTFSKNTAYYSREQRDVALGEKFTRGASTANLTGERTYLSNGQSASQLMTPGVMSTPAGGSGPARMMGPAVIIGHYIGATDIAVIAIGDSIIDGTADTNSPNGSDGSNGGGFLQRGLYQNGGRTIPLLRMSQSGSQAQQFVSSRAKRAALFAYATNLVENYGTNDFGDSARTATQVYADRQVIWAAFKAAAQGARRVEVMPIVPRTNSTDNWATLANQTARAGYATGGAFRDPMNENLAAALSAGLIDGIIDINSILADGTAPDKWIVNGVANYAVDSLGTHPSPAASALAGAVVAARATTWA